MPRKDICHMITAKIALEAQEKLLYSCQEALLKEPPRRHIRKSLKSPHQEVCNKLGVKENGSKRANHKKMLEFVENLSENNVLEDYPPVAPDKLMEKISLTRKKVTVCESRKG